MIGLLFLTTISAYIVITVLFVKYVYRSTENRTVRYCGIAAVLFPFWDIVIYPIALSILSAVFVEIDRLEPYEKVEGFYIKYVPEDRIVYSMFRYDTFDKKYSIYYGGRNDNYRKASWIKDSKSPSCYPLNRSVVKEEYLEKINDGWCIQVKSIDKEEVTRYWKLTEEVVFHLPILHVDAYVVDFFISDRHTGKAIIRLRDVFVEQSWFTALNVVSGRKSVSSGTEYTFATSEPDFFMYENKIIDLLDAEKLPDL